MGKVSLANLKKTIYYLKRNGLSAAIAAAAERLQGYPESQAAPPAASPETLCWQRQLWKEQDCSRRFSIVVPLYRTPENFLREMIRSLIDQTYPTWELVLADASGTDMLRGIAESFQDPRIVYFTLEDNLGISENTNAGILRAAGDYIGLLDHDDLLTPDALHEMNMAITEASKHGTTLQMVYSDEDKCDGQAQTFFEPHLKKDFDPDLLLTNNYICHFLVMKRELMQELLLRGDYNGAQDYDLVLRAADRLLDRPELIGHVPRILYHWRCHQASTAENPQSKLYAYEAGRRAVEDFLAKRHIPASVRHSRHLGFYQVSYTGDLFDARPDVGAVGGRICHRRKVIGGCMDEEGRALYGGLPVSFSGYLHRAVLAQDSYALDIRNLSLRKELWGQFLEVTGVPYRTRTVSGGKQGTETEIFDCAALPRDCDWKELSLRLSKAIREQGYRLLYLPDRRIDL